MTRLTATRRGAGIEITGLRETLGALSDFEPDLFKTLRKDIRGRLNRVAQRASGKRPEGIFKVSVKATGRDAGGYVISLAGSRGAVSVDEYLARKSATSWSPALRSVIGEFAGKNQPGRTPAAQAFIRAMSEHGAPGRFLWDAWDAEGGDNIIPEIEGLIRDAERVMQANLDAAGERY